MTGKLTTHVLDTANGCPAAGLTIELWQIDAEQVDSGPGNAGRANHLKTVITNPDGRTDTPILEEPNLVVGVYELWFAMGLYFTARSASKTTHPPQPPFLDMVPIRFGIADASAHYHVPLLCSPWSYSTYRGS